MSIARAATHIATQIVKNPATQEAAKEVTSRVAQGAIQRTGDQALNAMAQRNSASSTQAPRNHTSVMMERLAAMQQRRAAAPDGQPGHLAMNGGRPPLHGDDALPHMPSWNNRAEAQPYRPLHAMAPAGQGAAQGTPGGIASEDRLPHMPSWNSQGQALPHRPLETSMPFHAQATAQQHPPSYAQATAQQRPPSYAQATAKQGFRASMKAMAKSMFGTSSKASRPRGMELDGMTYGDNGPKLKIKINSNDIAAYKRETGRQDLDIGEYLAHRQQHPGAAGENVRISVGGGHGELGRLDLGQFRFDNRGLQRANANFNMLATRAGV